MIRNSTFYTMSGMLAVLALSANSASAGDHIGSTATPHTNIHQSNGSGGGTGAGKTPVTGVGGNRPIQIQQEQGDANHPYVIGGVYNGAGNGTTRRLKDQRY
jgi:hypothetical protein